MLVMGKWVRKTLLLIGALSMAVCLALTAVAAHLAVASHKALLGWLVLMLVCLCMSAFAISWGGVPWVYLNDIFPMSVKERAMSTSVFSQWVANFLIAYLVPHQVHLTSVPGTFASYAVCCAGAFALVCAFVPETKGLLLEEMGRLFGEPLDVPEGCVPQTCWVSLSVCGWCVAGCLVYIGTCRGVSDNHCFSVMS